jgi:hypothetical protein
MQMMSNVLATASYNYSMASNYRSPFYEKANKAGLTYPCQGKSDDITVVTARIIQDYI